MASHAAMLLDPKGFKKQRQTNGKYSHAYLFFGAQQPTTTLRNSAI